MRDFLLLDLDDQVKGPNKPARRAPARTQVQCYEHLFPERLRASEVNPASAELSRHVLESVDRGLTAGPAAAVRPTRRILE